MSLQYINFIIVPNFGDNGTTSLMLPTISTCSINCTNSLQNSTGYPVSMEYKNVAASTKQVVCAMFVSYVESVYNVNQVKFRELHGSKMSNFVIHFSEISEYDIVSVLSKFKLGCGTDNVPAMFLKTYARNLARTLAFLFNKSLKLGIHISCKMDNYNSKIFSNAWI